MKKKKTDKLKVQLRDLRKVKLLHGVMTGKNDERELQKIIDEEKKNR